MRGLGGMIPRGRIASRQRAKNPLQQGEEIAVHCTHVQCAELVQSSSVPCEKSFASLRKLSSPRTKSSSALNALTLVVREEDVN